MYVIGMERDGNQGAYSITNEYDEQVILLFDMYEDAERYLGMLNEMDIKEINFENLSIIEYDEEMVVKTCKLVGFKYCKVTKDDLLVPPGYFDDNI